MQHAADNLDKSTFRKQDRLTSSLEIDALYRENNFILFFPLKCYYSFSPRPENKNTIQVAFAVPKKTFKNAVIRNLLKRRMREAYRLNYKQILEPFKTQNEQQLKLFFVYIGKKCEEYAVVEKNLVKVLEKLLNVYI